MHSVSVVKGSMKETTVKHQFVKFLVRMVERVPNLTSVNAQLDIKPQPAAFLFVSVSVKMVERVLPPTSVNASRVTLASGVKHLLANQTVSMEELVSMVNVSAQPDIKELTAT